MNMNEKRNSIHHCRTLAITAFATILLASLGVYANEAFAMGEAPSTCSWTASSSDLWDDVAVEIKASATG